MSSLRNLVIMLITLTAVSCRYREPKSDLLAKNSEEVILPITGVKINLREIDDIVKLPIGELINTLRSKYKIKVMIIDYSDQYPKATYPNILKYNIAEDSEAMKFYLALRKGDKVDSEAVFMKAYEYDDSQAISARNRPYIEYDLMILHKNIDKNMITHEFIHFLISRSPQRKMSAGSKMSYRTSAFQLAKDYQKKAKDAKENYDKTLREAKLKSDEKAKMRVKIVASKYFDIQVDALLFEMINYDLSAGEEMDITRLMYEYGDRFYQEGGATREEYDKNLCINYYHSNFKKWTTMFQLNYATTKKLISSYELLAPNGLLSNDSAKKFQTFITKDFKLRQQTYNETIDWLKKTVKELKILPKP